MKKFFAIFAAIIFLSSTSCSAENLKFIDALDDTGYYYDADSVNFDDYGSFTVKMAVIKASLNRMYAYDVRITPAEKVYEILATQSLSYDTRAVLDSNYTPRPPQRYSDRSEMGQMVSLILNDN